MKRIWIPQAIAAVMLLWALNPENPYGYYILLRWVCCGTFAYLALKAHSQGKEGWVWGLGVMAVIYNSDSSDAGDLVGDQHRYLDSYRVINLCCESIYRSSPKYLRVCRLDALR